MHKLESWQYSSLSSDDLLADLDKIVAEVTKNHLDIDSDSDGTVAAVAVACKQHYGIGRTCTHWQFSFFFQSDAVLCHVSVAQSNGMPPTSTDMMCLCLMHLMLWQPASFVSHRNHLQSSQTLALDVTGSMCTNDPSAQLWTFLTARRFEYTAVMDYLKPVQDLIVSEHLDAPGRCTPFTDTVCMLYIA